MVSLIPSFHPSELLSDTASFSWLGLRSSRVLPMLQLADFCKRFAVLVLETGPMVEIACVLLAAVSWLTWIFALFLSPAN